MKCILSNIINSVTLTPDIVVEGPYYNSTHSGIIKSELTYRIHMNSITLVTSVSTSSSYMSTHPRMFWFQKTVEQQ